jgi:hypothetical protein
LATLSKAAGNVEGILLRAVYGEDDKGFLTESLFTLDWKIVSFI